MATDAGASDDAACALVRRVVTSGLPLFPDPEEELPRDEPCCFLASDALARRPSSATASQVPVGPSFLAPTEDTTPVEPPVPDLPRLETDDTESPRLLPRPMPMPLPVPPPGDTLPPRLGEMGACSGEGPLLGLPLKSC